MGSADSIAAVLNVIYELSWLVGEFGGEGVSEGNCNVESVDAVSLLSSLSKSSWGFLFSGSNVGLSIMSSSALSSAEPSMDGANASTT